jgi:hypothetical protein
MPMRFALRPFVATTAIVFGGALQAAGAASVEAALPGFAAAADGHGEGDGCWAAAVAVADGAAVDGATIERTVVVAAIAGSVDVAKLRAVAASDTSIIVFRASIPGKREPRPRRMGESAIVYVDYRMKVAHGCAEPLAQERPSFPGRK